MKKGRTRTALLVVDVQMDVVAQALHREEVIARIGELVSQARAKGVPVIWVQHHDAYLKRGTAAWAIVPELQPQPDEPVIHKAYGDSFAETELEAQLAGLDVGELVLCGAQSDMCIHATLYGGLYRGYPVKLVQDAHTTEDGEFGGRPYSADLLVNWVNRNAASARLPGVASRLVTHDRAFA